MLRELYADAHRCTSGRGSLLLGKVGHVYCTFESLYCLADAVIDSQRHRLAFEAIIPRVGRAE